LVAGVGGLAPVSAVGTTATPSSSPVGSRSSGWSGRRQLGVGLSIAVPAGWHVARRLTGLVEPYERFTLASFSLRRPAHSDCGPNQVVDGMPADGALAFVIEYPRRGGFSRSSFPPQPGHFRLPPGPAQRYDCFALGWLVRFRSGGRPFQVMIALGPRSAVNRGRLLRALSSLRVTAIATP
jgi:hypothetical protein